jgi:cation diffusion facilitator family transporter
MEKSHENASKKSIIFALSANFGIAVTKTVAAIITGSGAMLAESIHSFADCGNQILLFLGLKTSKKEPNVKHPLGYGKAIFFWSFVVALILFSMGGCFSIYEGVHKLSTHEGLKYPIVALCVLFISMLMEGASLFGCIKQVNKVRRSKNIFKWIMNTRKSELVIVMGEDVAALLGLFFAFIAVLLSIITGNPIYDAIGSIGIGVLLVCVSIFLGIKIEGLLIGQSASDYDREDILQFLKNRPEIEEILNLITLQLGDRIMVAVKAKMMATQTTDELIDNINKCESELRKVKPSVQWIFFEPDNK